MAERLCGYCRQLGHRKPECPDFLYQRNIILTHTPKQRKVLIEGLGKIGMGIGALLRVQDYWDRTKYSLAIVKDFEWVSHTNFIDARQVKYSKRVRLQEHYVESDYTNRSIHAELLGLSGAGETMRVSVPITRLLMRQKDPNSVPPEGNYYNSINFTIDAPSHDIDYDPEILVRSVSMPRRLITSGESQVAPYVRGIMP